MQEKEPSLLCITLWYVQRYDKYIIIVCMVVYDVEWTRSRQCLLKY